MPIGPGKYDAACTIVRAMTGADGVVLIVIGGVDGQGFAVQGSRELTEHLPQLLRGLADAIELDMRSAAGPAH